MEEIYRGQIELLEHSSRNTWQQALEEALQKLQKSGKDTGAYTDVAECCRRLGRPEDALSVLKDGISCCAPDITLYKWYVNTLELCNKTEEAIAAAGSAARLFPGELWMKLKKALLLPIVYDTPEEIERCRRRFT